MGLVGVLGAVLGPLFGGGRNVLRETAGVFRENADAGAQRAAEAQAAARQQFAAEFAQPAGDAGRGWFDRGIDALNRLPRPMLALGTIGLIASAMVDPVWFAARMQGLALVPEPLWWLMGAVVSFYFGARYQAKGQEFQRSLAQTLARSGMVADDLRRLRDLRGPDGAAGPGTGDNPALRAWREARLAPGEPGDADAQ